MTITRRKFLQGLAATIAAGLLVDAAMEYEVEPVSLGRSFDGSAWQPVESDGEPLEIAYPLFNTLPMYRLDNFGISSKEAQVQITRTEMARAYHNADAPTAQAGDFSTMSEMSNA